MPATGWGGTLVVAIFGAALLLIAPWLTRAVVTAGPLAGPLAASPRHPHAAGPRPGAGPRPRGGRLGALLRQVERDLHDGARVRLAAMAMNLGMAMEKLGADGRAPDVERARELVDAFHLGAKEALVEQRELVRGIHPPVLDAGLAEALATLAAGSAIPVRVTAGLPVRPTPAIETIAYFCAAELLASATKHSGANKIGISADITDSGRAPVLRVGVCDDGRGGADPAGGSGLAWLERRVGTVDGRLRIRRAAMPAHIRNGQNEKLVAFYLRG